MIGSTEMDQQQQLQNDSPPDISKYMKSVPAPAKISNSAPNTQPPQAPTQQQQTPPLKAVADNDMPPKKEDYMGDTPYTKEASSIFSNDVKAGILTGITQSSPANYYSILESYAPNWWPKRLQFSDPEHPDKFTDPSIQTVSSYAGMTPEEYDNAPASKIRKRIRETTKKEIKKVYGADEHSDAFFWSNIGGMLGVDMTLGLPALGKTWTQKAATASLVGGMDIGAYEAAELGNPTPSGIATGMILGPLAVGVARALKRDPTTKVDSATRKQSSEKLQQFWKTYDDLSKTTTSPGKAFNDALHQHNLSQYDVEDLLVSSHHADSKYAAYRRDTTYFDRLFEPISDGLRRKSTVLHKRLNDMERRTRETFHNLAMESDTFVRTVEKSKRFNPKLFNEIKLAMLNSDAPAFNTLLRTYPKYMPKYDLYKGAMDTSYDLQAKYRNGSKTTIGPKQEVYLHRAVKDGDAIRAWLEKHGGKGETEFLDKLVQKYYPNGASLEQKNQVLTNYLAGFYDKKGVLLTPSAVKQRKIQKIPMELVDAFHDPAKATHTYLRSAVEDSYRKQFFGKHLVDKYGDEINDSLFTDLVAKELEAGRLKGDDLIEVRRLLATRFIDGAKTPIKAIQGFKDLSYASLLGNPLSAITQIGDIFIATAKYGFRDTMRGIATALGKRGFTPKELGLMDNLIEEMASETKTRKILNFSLKYGGFAKVDELGKAVHLNAALAQGKRLTKSARGMRKLQAKWGTAFGDDFPQLVDDLRKGIKTSNTKTYVFAELADVQPITMLEMPEVYAKMPNGRLLYMLRTFQLKYFNLLRKNVWYEMKRGNYVPAIKAAAALTTAFVIGTGSTDYAKDYLLGKDTNAGEYAVNGLLKMSGFTDRYSFNKMSKSSDPMSTVVSNIAPPVNTLSPTLATILQLSTKGEVSDVTTAKLINQIPIIGRILYNFGLEGTENHNARKFKEWKRVE